MIVYCFGMHQHPQRQPWCTHLVPFLSRDTCTREVMLFDHQFAILNLLHIGVRENNPRQICVRTTKSKDTETPGYSTIIYQLNFWSRMVWVKRNLKDHSVPAPPPRASFTKPGSSKPHPTWPGVYSKNSLVPQGRNKHQLLSETSTTLSSFVIQGKTI